MIKDIDNDGSRKMEYYEFINLIEQDNFRFKK